MWTSLGGLGILAVVMLNFFLPRRPTEGEAPWAWLEVTGYAVVLLVLLIAIFFSQSRGPQIGLLAGLAVFINLFLFRLMERKSGRRSPSTRLLRGMMRRRSWSNWRSHGFLLAFNLSQAPFFQRLA